MAEQYTNFGTQTLIAGLAGTSTATTWLVTTNAGYPTSTPFHVTIDTEILLCTASTLAAGTFTMSGSRGQESTSVTTHASGVTVLHALTAGAMDQIRADIQQTGAYPGISAKTGNIFWPNNASAIQRDNGSTMAPWGPIYPLGDPNTNTWTFVNSNTNFSTETTHGGIALINNNVESAFMVRGLVKAVPATPYHCEFGWMRVGQASSNAMAGPMFSNGTGFEIADPRFQSTVNQFVVFYLTATNVFSGSTPVNNTTFYQLGGPLIWCRIGDNGTLKTWDISADGYMWTQIGSESHATNLTPTQVGFYTNYGISNLRLLHYKETA